MNHRYARLGLVIAAVAVLASPAQADRPSILPIDCERSLAVSAAPDYLRDEASVYVLSESGYVLDRSGSNHFTCIVNRDDPRVLKPTCFDKEGARTIVPKIAYFGSQMLEALSVDDINQDIARKFEDGTFVSPARPGVAYMLSRYNRPVNRQTGELGFFPPHVMFYAPDLTNEDIGHDMSKHDMSRSLPMIAYGGPQGYMIMISDDGTPRSRTDLPASCPAWIFAE